VLAHWPLDSHRDHRALALLVYDAWLRSGRAFALFYTEAETGIQTQHFTPTHYVDISSVEARKRAACEAHVSQNPAGFYGYHDNMQRFRGQESGCAKAEAFRAAVFGDLPR
jgi:LmbE family N-acetylglucosaminyl deacetylase